MDSITQALLGGAVGLAVAGRRHPRRAWLYGAVAGTLPDLDVVIDYGNAVDNFTRHRGFTHSWLVQSAAAPLLAWALSRLDRHFTYARWLALVWLVLVTHAGLDALTVYGTQLFWPLHVQPASGGSVFIIDPLYTLPLLVLAIVVLVRPPALPLRAAGIALVASTAYLGFGLGAQQAVERRVAAEIDRQGIEARRIDVTAAPFTTLLWRVVVMTPNAYLQGFASLLDPGGEIRFTAFDRGAALEPAVSDDPRYRRLTWFSHGFISLGESDGRLLATDLRMGSEPSYVFRFVLMERGDGGWHAVSPTRLPRPDAPPGFFQALWQRIFDPLADAAMIALARPSDQHHDPDECGQSEADQHRC